MPQATPRAELAMPRRHQTQRPSRRDFLQVAALSLGCFKAGPLGTTQTRHHTQTTRGLTIRLLAGPADAVALAEPAAWALEQL